MDVGGDGHAAVQERFSSNFKQNKNVSLNLNSTEVASMSQPHSNMDEYTINKLNTNKSARHISAGRLGGTFSHKAKTGKKKLSKIESKPAFSSTHQRNSRV